MTIQVHEIHSGRRASQTDDPSATRVFKVYEDDITVALDEWAALTHPDVPDFGDDHPTIPDLGVNTRAIDPLDDERFNSWRVTIVYSGPPEFSWDIQYDPIEIEVTSQFINTWRTLPTIPGNLNTPAESDIGGTAIDSKGEAISSLVNQQTMSITRTIDKYPDVGIYLAYAGKRNQFAFMGADAGSVLYKGVRMSRISRKGYSETHDFVWDQFFHLRQIIDLDDDKNPKVGQTGTYADKGYPVYFKQPFPNLADFRGLGIEFPT